MRYLPAAVTALLLTLGQLPAQSPASSTLPTGAVVRVGVPLREGQRVVRVRKFEGTVVRHTPSALTISIERPLCPLICDSESVEFNLAIDSLQYVEMPVGRSRVRGGLLGLLVGGVLGVLLWQGAGIDCDDAGHGADCLRDGSRPSQGQYLAEGGALGALVGGTIGWMVGVVRWERVDFRAGPIAAAGGVNVGLTIRR
jgi:hypothetical protein